MFYFTPLLLNQKLLLWTFRIDRGFACEWLVGVLYGQRYCKLNDEEFTSHIKSDIVGFVESEASEADQLSLKGNSLIHKTIRPRENKCIHVQISPRKKLFFRVSPRNSLCAKKKYFSRRKIKVTFSAESFFREISRRNSAKSSRRHSAIFLGETPRNREW